MTSLLFLRVAASPRRRVGLSLPLFSVHMKQMEAGDCNAALNDGVVFVPL
jgi:hypothetical protein